MSDKNLSPLPEDQTYTGPYPPHPGNFQQQPAAGDVRCEKCQHPVHAGMCDADVPARDTYDMISGGASGCSCEFQLAPPLERAGALEALSNRVYLDPDARQYLRKSTQSWLDYYATLDRPNRRAVAAHEDVIELLIVLEAALTAAPAEAVCDWYEVAKDKSPCVPMGSHPRNCGVHLGGKFQAAPTETPSFICVPEMDAHYEDCPHQDAKTTAEWPSKCVRCGGTGGINVLGVCRKCNEPASEGSDA